MPVATSFLNGSLLDRFYLRPDHNTCSAYKGALETLARSTFPFRTVPSTVLCTMTPRSKANTTTTTTASTAIPREKAVQAVREEKQMKFPSLCDQIAEPEAHPDYEAAMATFGHQQRKFKSLVPHRPQLPRLIGPLTASTCAPRETLLPPLLAADRSHNTFNGVLSPRTVVSTDHRPPREPVTDISPVRKRRGSALSSLVEVSPPRPAKMFATTDYKIKVVSFYTPAHPRGYLPGAFAARGNGRCDL